MRVAISLLLFALCGTQVREAAASPAGNPPRNPFDLRFESSELARKLFREMPPDSTSPESAGTAACSEPRAYWLVASGISTQNHRQVTDGLRAIAMELSPEQNDGSFACPDPFLAAATAIEDASRSLLLLRSADEASKLYGVTAPLLPKIHLAAKLLTIPRLERGEMETKSVARHFLVAAALGEAGVVTGDHVLVHKSWEYALAAIRLQAPKPGVDTLEYAERFYVDAANDQTQLKIRPFLERGFESLGRETSHGGAKTIRALAYFGLLTGNTRWVDLAHRALARAHPAAQ